MSYTNEQIAAMRDWCLDCCNSDDEIDIVETASDEDVLSLVRRNYDGGVQQCLIDAMLA